MQLLAQSEPLPEACAKPILVMGCGNVLFGDDGLGPAVIAELERRVDRATRERVCLLDAGTAARTVLFDVLIGERRPWRIVVIDAVDAGRPPGEVFRLALDELPESKLDDFSMHQLPASNLLRELRDGCGVSVEILACQVQAIPSEVSPGLSDPVQRAIPRICQTVLDEVGSHEQQSGERRARRKGRKRPARGERS